MSTGAVTTAAHPTCRHLLALALHYATEKEDRLVIQRSDGTATCAGEEIGLQWVEDAFIQKMPRALLCRCMGRRVLLCRAGGVSAPPGRFSIARRP